MKKALIGLAAIGAALALRPLVKRRTIQKMREHCEQMAAQHGARNEPVAIA